MPAADAQCGNCGANLKCADGDCVCEFVECNGICCASDELCEADVCTKCVPEDAAVTCDQKQCGQSTNNCGAAIECGTCAENENCVDSLCECVPACDGKACGDDGCGGQCGTCTGTNEQCIDGKCTCVPACVDKQCGDDGCSGSCGTCTGVNEQCVDGKCTCQP